MKNTSKKWLIGASAVIALTLAGCSQTNDGDTDSVRSQVAQEQQVQPLHIAKPVIMDVEDDVVDTDKLQENLDAINDGERLPSYEPVNEDERVLEVPTDRETNNDPYTVKDPKDLHEGTHFVYVGRDTCPYCQMLRVNLDPVVEQMELNLGYIDTDSGTNEQYMVDNFGLVSVPMIAVFHDGEAVAMFPQQHMYLEAGANYESLANGLGDLTNIYLSYKHGVDMSQEGVQDTTATESDEEGVQESGLDSQDTSEQDSQE